jgi:hypothetical protein
MIAESAEFERQFATATRRGNHRLANVPVAVGVDYNRRSRKIVIELSNGCTLLVPPELAQGLSDATPTELADARIIGPGTAIDWPQRDVQFSVEGLLAGNFGSPAWMASKRTSPSRRSPNASASAKRRDQARVRK